jgi:cytochrome c peroxidase
VPGLAFEMGEGFYELFPNYKGSVYEQKYRLVEDTGRIQVTREPTDRHMWRVSGLRNVAVTAPYFHNGRVATLAEAVSVMGKTQLNKELSPTQVDDIVAFLHTLTGAFPAQTLPSLPMTLNEATAVPP